MKNSGTAWPIDAVYFSNQPALLPLPPVGGTPAASGAATVPATVPRAPNSLYYADENAGAVPVTTNAGFRADANGRVLYLPADPSLTSGIYTNIYRVQDSGFLGQVTANRSQSLAGLGQATGTLYRAGT